MKKKSSALFWIILFLLAIGAAYLYLNRQKLIPLMLSVNNQSTTTAGQLLGGGRDAHGCIASAGYSWCDVKQKCLRPWEEACEATTSANIVNYYCQEGVLTANFSTSSVALTFKDGSTTTLPQVRSGSGIRYEKGTTVLIGKGDNAFLTQKNKTTYTNCVAGKQTTSQDTNTYTDNGNTFSFSYPKQFLLSGGDIGYSQDWSYNASSSGLLLAVVNIPRSFLPGTNFGEAKFSVGTSADPDTVKNCLKASYGDFGTTTILTIGDRQFTKITYTDVGAGNYYDVASYRTVYNGQCYVAETLIHSSNIDNYSPDQGIKPFDRLKVSLVLDGMARSFKLLPTASTTAQ
jgi:membrane-bound inhibitor of C-type lysozyme